MIRGASVLALLLACSACMPAPPSEPAGGPPADQPPYIQGTITSVTASDTGGVVVVEAADNTAAVTVTATTVVVQELGGGYEPASFGNLGPNLPVSVWITGPVRESFPVQVEATGIVILER